MSLLTVAVAKFRYSNELSQVAIAKSKLGFDARLFAD
jgi:hypothetical protein